MSCYGRDFVGNFGSNNGCITAYASNRPSTRTRTHTHAYTNSKRSTRSPKWPNGRGSGIRIRDGRKLLNYNMRIGAFGCTLRTSNNTSIEPSGLELKCLPWHDLFPLWSLFTQRSETCTGCGGELSGVSGSFVSPNYPLPYGHSTQCFWTITVSRGSKIQLRFSDFNLEMHYVCRWDVLEVYISSLFLRAMLRRARYCHGKLSVLMCLSVRPSVTLRYRGHVGWNSWKIISRLLA